MRRLTKNLALAAVLVGLCWARPAGATNGMNPIAFGARAAGMAGADLAVSGDTSAMNVNPAGIAALGLRVDASFSGLLPKLKLTDSAMGGQMPLNTSLSSESAFFPMFDVGFTANVWRGLSVGLGVFVQGGMGANFKKLATFVDADPATAGDPSSPGAMSPASYETNSQLMFMKATPTVAYRFEGLGDVVDLSIGVAGNFGLASLTWEHTGMQFPEMDGDHMFGAHAVKYDSGYAFVIGARAGLLATFLDGMLGVGVAYGTQSKLPFKGETTIDGQLTYDTTVKDFNWAQDVGVGVAVRPIADLLVAVDYRRVFWSGGVDTVTFENVAKGQVPAGYERLDMPFRMAWVDQNVIAAGVEYDLFDLVALRAGYNYGSNPVTADGVNPLFPALTVHHVTGGVGVHDFGVKGLAFDLAFEVAPASSVTSNANAQMAQEPAMPGAEPTPNGYQVGVEMDQMTFHLGASYAF
jgi:long-chain fatty acid transport protein